MTDEAYLDSADATDAAGRRLAAALLGESPERVIVWLHGELGAGKTTLARGFLAGCGHPGRVPSPTYTLVEPYELDPYVVYHVDLYRLADAREVDDLALADCVGPRVVMLIEWPERAAGRLEAPDLELTLTLDGAGRRLVAVPRTAVGECLLAHKNV